MKIDRHNYEEFFILYLDNELTADQRCEVETFAQQHADLKEELELLLQSKLLPDEAMVFGDTGMLLKTGGLSVINKNNYEEWFVSYADNELTAAQRKEVEYFIANHSSLQNELTLLLKAKLDPETIVFPYKESLYRKEEKAPVVPINWKRYAAAAALLLAISTAAFFALRKNDTTEGASGLAGNNPVNKKGNTVVEKTNQPTVQLPVVKQDDITIAQSDVKKPVINNKNAAIEKERAIQQQPVQPKEEVLAVNVPEKETNNLPRPKNNIPVITGSNTGKNNTIAMVDVPSRPLTKEIEEITGSGVTPATDESLILAKNTTPTEDVVVNGPGGNKNKLRGFFRKLTRTFEKNTNIKATDEEDRLLVGGLAIRL